MTMRTMRLAVGLVFLLAAGVRARAQDSPIWVQDVDIRSLNIEEALQSYSPWTLLADSVAKSTTSRSKVQVEVHYVNPITYLHLRAATADGQSDAEARRGELQEIFGKYAVFYLLLKTPDDEGLIKAGDWKVWVKTAGGKELAADKVEGSEPELVFGYTGVVYQTKLMAYVPGVGADGKPAIDILKGDYLVASNKAKKISEEARWVAAASARNKASPLSRTLFKVILCALLAALVVLCFLTRPRRDWLARKIGRNTKHAGQQEDSQRHD